MSNEAPSWPKSELKFAKSIGGGVSRWGTLEMSDLLALAEALATVPPHLGGPSGPIPLPNPKDPLLSFNPALAADALFAALHAFQQQQFGKVIEPDAVTAGSRTMLKLANLASGHGGDLWAIKGTPREKAIQAASDEGQLVGDVGYLDYGSERRDWQRLQMYFDESLEIQQLWSQKHTKLYPLHYKAPDGVFRTLGTRLDGVRIKGMRIPQKTRAANNEKPHEEDWPGVHWCGIFANWCWRKAGAETKWRMGDGPVAGNRTIPTESDISRLLPGDIVVMKGKSIHHALVACIDANGKSFRSIDGNSTEHGIGQTVGHKLREIGDIRYFIPMAGAVPRA